jgi:sugar O-acyltransferase (sialic acid O-acetyltransferase NeuD family)
MKEQILLVGAFHEAVELCELCGLEIAGIFDNSKQGDCCGYPILGDDSSAAGASAGLKRIPVLLTPDQPALRKRLAECYAQLGFGFRSVISPEARVSKSAVLGRAVFIQSGCNVSAAAQLGDFVRLNSLANVMHDSVVGAFSTVAPNAVVLGKVTIGEECYIGANCTILPRLQVQSGAVVGAGAVVTNSVARGTTVVGVPARRLERR